MPAKKDFDFKKAFSELEAIVEEFEKGDIDLEKGLKKFEEGLTLAAACKERLAEVENKVVELKGKFGSLDEE